MASLLTPRRECQCCTKSDGVCSGEVVVITTSQIPGGIRPLWADD